MKMALVIRLGLRLGSQSGQRAKVVVNDLKPVALPHRRDRHHYPDLNPETLFSKIFEILNSYPLFLAGREAFHNKSRSTKAGGLQCEMYVLLPVV
jgi:hypothetical protein